MMVCFSKEAILGSNSDGRMAQSASKTRQFYEWPKKMNGCTDEVGIQCIVNGSSLSLLQELLR
jgi:hypothetical protein